MNKINFTCDELNEIEIAMTIQVTAIQVSDADIFSFKLAYVLLANSHRWLKSCDFKNLVCVYQFDVIG